MVAVPPAVVTLTFLEPAEPTGVIAVMELPLTISKFVAATSPISTLVAPVKLVPEIVMEVPQVVGPEFGLTVEMVGTATAT